jgi:outer membrane receptor for ferrienterochelin and colicin
MAARACPHKAAPSSRAARLLLCASLAVGSSARATGDLTGLSLEQLMGLTVVGASKYEQKQSEVAASVSVITRNEIRAFGWRTMADALASLPGIHTTYDRQYSFVGARGFGLPGDYNTRVLLAINGNRTNDVTYDQAPVGRDFPLDMDLIERIEFIPGPGGAVYGQNAMFGVVNVITRTGASVAGTEVAAAWQQPQRLGEGRASWGRKLDNGVDVLFSVSGLRSRGEDRFFEFGSTGISGIATDQDGDHDKEFVARVARGPWSLEVVDGIHRKDNPTGTYKSDPLVPGQYQGDRYSLAQWQYQDDHFGDTLQFQARLFAGRAQYDGALSYGAPSILNAVSDWRGLELRLLSTVLAGHKLMLGLEYQDNPHVRQSVTHPADPASDFVVVGSGQRTGVYVQDEWRVSDAVTATLGLRVDRNNVTGNQASPRAALIWQATPATTLKALLGRAHRAPNAYERDYTDGVSSVNNPTLQGESIDTLEMVADHRVASDLQARASVYQWTMRDLITLGADPVTGLARYQSGDTVHAKGIELSIDKTWGWGGRARGSLSLQNVRYANGAALLNSPQRLAKLNVSTPLAAGSRLGYELRYDSSRRTADGTELGGYTLSNLRLSTDRLAKGLELSLGISNLFDKAYSQPNSDAGWQNALEQDGRGVRVEALYRF